ncbi:MAG: hypothetical protein V4807_12565 [Burkholderia gladioli]
MDWWPWIKRGAYVLFGAMLLALIVSGQYGQTVAAWAQAIGAIAAIGGAAWVAQGQMRQARADDAEETRAFVQAVLDELTVVWDDYAPTLGKRLRETGDDEILSLPAPPRKRVFVIYPNNSARLGKVDDAELRRLIVDVYAQAESLLHAFRVLHKLGDTVRVMGEAEPNHLSAYQKEQRAYLARLTHSLKVGDEKIELQLGQLKAQAAAWLARST